MRKRSRESLPGIFTPVLTAPILAGIHQLNRDYVELLIAARPDQQHTTLLPPAVVSGLAGLPSSARSAIAACPFALYSLGIEHQDMWRKHAREPSTNDNSAKYPGRDGLAPSAFAISALFFAWHVANSQRVAAKVFYAMPDVAIDSMTRMSLADLQHIACASGALLAPRWPTNGAFWPDLIRFAALGDMHRLTMTQLLGSQLIAADLCANAVQRGRVRHTNVLSMRTEAHCRARD